MGNLYVIRHGQTDCNADQVIQGPRLDSELDSIGQNQAKALGDAFTETRLDAMYVSPLRRARQTAHALMERRAGQVAAAVVPELYEMDYGDLCGRRVPDVQDIVDEILDAWSMGFVDQSFPGGESLVLAQHRVRAFARGVVAEALERDVAVVAHGRINRILLATITGTHLKDIGRFPQSNASISHMAVDDEGVRVRRINDTGHLDDDVMKAFS